MSGALPLLFALLACGCSENWQEPPAGIPTAETIPTTSGSDRVESLLRAVEDPAAPARLRMDAAAELAARGEHQAVPALVAMLSMDMDRRTGVWSAAIPALGALGDARAVPVLCSALELRDDDWLGRGMAATALGEIGDPEAVPVLLAAARMADTRTLAVAALAAIGDARAAPLFVDVLAGGDDEEILSAAEHGLLALGPAAVTALAAAFEAPPESGRDQAVAAARVLGRLGEPSAIPLLRAAADDPRPAVRQAAREALAAIREREEARR
jgi:HEAT repeat protein